MKRICTAFARREGAQGLPDVIALPVELTGYNMDGWETQVIAAFRDAGWETSGGIRIPIAGGTKGGAHHVATAEQTRAVVLSQYAINTGSLYPSHLKLARAKASEDAWRDHVRDMVIPLYRHEAEPNSQPTANAINEAADFLRAYYDSHVKEL